VDRKSAFESQKLADQQSHDYRTTGVYQILGVVWS